MKKRIGSILAACSIIMATAAFGANKAEQFSISPVVGGYTFDDKQHLDTNLVYGLRAGYNVTDNFGIEALIDYVNTEANRANNRVEMYRYGGELLYHFMPESTFVPYLAVGLAGLHFDAFGKSSNTYTAFDTGVGAKYFVNDKFALRADARYIVYSNNSLAKNNLEYTLGAYIPFGGAKPVVKPVEPPPAPAPPPPAPKVEPPPPPPAPTAALTVTPATVTKGETATLNWRSQNASGCDIQPGIGPVPPQGVRAITPADSTSYNLSCSGAGGTATSAAGVTVVLPPPPPKPKAAERFCDKPSTIVVEFDTNKSDIKTKYDQDLNKLGTFLKEWPKAKGEISGHTDNVGSDKYNLGLSQRRAASVKKYLVEKFSIAPERLTTEGYGETKPIATNKTKEGRQLNRRIETNFTCD
jgi:OOP family OmpA-OmpF porin